MHILGLNRFRRLLGLPLPLYVEPKKRLAARYLNPAPVVVEAGAHFGYDSAVMAQLWPKGTIHAFEPVPKTYASLVQNVGVFSNIKTYPLALSDRSGQTTMHISSGNEQASSSILQPTGHLIEHPDVLFAEVVTVPTMTLDDWVEQAGVSCIDFLWLDMQGCELQMMQAAPKTLARVTAVLTEVSYVNLYKGAPLENEITAWMKGQGFKIARRWRNGHDSGDVLFVH